VIENATSRDGRSDVTCRGIFRAARYSIVVAVRTLFMIVALASAACGRFGFGERPDARGESSISVDADCPTCNDGLIAHWPMDEGMGSIARDIVGGHDVTMMGFELGWSDGVHGGAADVTYGYGLVPWDLPAAAPDAFTVAMWQQPRTESSSFDRYFGSYNWDGLDHGAIEMDNFSGDGLRCIAYLGGQWEYIEADAVFSPTDWRHVACVYDGATLRIYGNGALLETLDPVAAPFMASEPRDVAIGATVDANGTAQNIASGRFDDVRIYDRALTATELAALAAR
jgi:hypothetical protein